MKEAISGLEKETGKNWAIPSARCWFVRSGAKFSMPGMMDTILNLGLNDQTVADWPGQTGNPRFAYDCYRRFIQMFGDVVLGVEHYKFEKSSKRCEEKTGVELDTELDAEDWQEVIRAFKELIWKETKNPFPQEPMEQLKQAIVAVFSSWNNHRAKIYRKINGFPDDLGTAVNVQTMVFGNMGNESGTGVCFTRNPSSGEKELYGEYSFNAQGRRCGRRHSHAREPIADLEKEMPDVYEELVRICNQLESAYRDMQDIEFTIENKKLYILQTRVGKRTSQAAVKIAVQMAGEGIISREEALMRVEPEQLEQMLHRRIDHNAKLTAWAKGLPASPGAASGQIVFDADTAEAWAKRANGCCWSGRKRRRKIFMVFWRHKGF